MFPDSLEGAFAVLGLILLILSALVFIVALCLPARYRDPLLKHLWRKWII